MSLPQLEFREPPPPLSLAARQRGGFTATGATNTLLGDRVEAAVRDAFGLDEVHPGRRQGPLDLRSRTHGFEVKACTTAASEYRAKLKSRERLSKLAEAEELGLLPATVMVVVPPCGTGHAYWREGIGSFRLGRGWSYSGEVRVDLSGPQ